MIGVNVNKVPEPELSYSYPKFVPLSSARYARIWKCCETILSLVLIWISIFHCDMWINEKIRKNRETWDKEEGHFYHEFRNAFSLLQCPLPSPLSSKSFLVLQDLDKSNNFFSGKCSQAPLCWIWCLFSEHPPPISCAEVYVSTHHNPL